MYRLCPSANKVSKANDDFPLPETPQTTINLFFGMPPAYRINKVLEHAVVHRLSPKVADLPSMSSLVLSGRTADPFDHLLFRGLNFLNMLLKISHLGAFEIPVPQI